MRDSSPAHPADSEPEQEPWYLRSSADVAAELGVDVSTGLTSSEAASRLAADGPNSLGEEKSSSGLQRFLGEYASYMQIILVVAGALSFGIGEVSTGLLLVILTVVNAVIGMRQKGKAESAMNALKSMLKASARVRRDGVEAQVPGEQVVRGDVVVLAAGDQVPADGRIVEASSLQIDESALTGESVPASKNAEAVTTAVTSPGDQSDMAFMNTPVTHGRGTMVVTATGQDTEVGKISSMLAATKQEKTPLNRQIDTMTLWIAAAAGLTMVVMFATGLYREQPWETLFITAIALAVASIPEALPTVVDVILSSGSLALAKANAIVKDLGSVQTLGATSAINSDKTGTLTMNQMTVVEVLDPTDRYTVSGSGYSLEGKIHHAAGSSESIEDAILPFVLANDAKLVDGKVVGDPTEGAFLVLAHKAGLSLDATRDKYPRRATLPFDPTYKLMATFHDAVDAAGNPVVRAFVKGAGPAIDERSDSVLSQGEVLPLDDETRTRRERDENGLEEAGLRVMAAAYKDFGPADFDPAGDLLALMTGLTRTAVVGMIDPPRAESKAAVHEAQAAKIQVRMVTGDDVVTGAAIAQQLGIPGEAVLGADFAAMTEQERLARIDDIGVVGRVAPEHKVLIAETLKAKGHVVAMTGDGVNDAPAIKAADIGIAMGSGTQVAKNAARMILTDDNFATIVLAVRQGRKLYDNLLKFIRFILITLVFFVLAFLAANIFDISEGQPFTPVQILWINFLIDSPLGVAIGFDKETPGLMRLKPRPRDQGIITGAVLTTTGLTGVFMAVTVLALIQVGADHYGAVAIGTTMALTAFALFRVVGAFESRSMRQSCFSLSTFDNRTLTWMALGQLVLAFLVSEWGVLNDLLGTQPLTGPQWLLALAPALALLLLWEIGKVLARARQDDSRPAELTDLEPAPDIARN